MIIPPESLSAEALGNIIEEFINREGTDYGETERSLAQKVAELRPQILRGEVLIVYDEQLQTVNLVHKRDAGAIGL